MKVIVNGEEVETQKTSLKELLEELEIKAQGSAVACNGEIVPSSTWDTFKLEEQQTFDVFTLVAGG